MVMTLSNGAYLEAEVVGNELMAGLGRLHNQGASAGKVRDFIVNESAPKIASLVARELNADKHARALVLKTYLTARDPMAEYREVAAYDYITVLGQQYPEQFVWEWEEEGPTGGELFGLGKAKISKKMRKKLKKVGKVVAIGAAVVAAVALTVVTAGAAAPIIAAAVSTGGQLAQQKKAAKEAKKMDAAMQEASAYPPIDQLPATVQAATQAVAQSQYATTPVAQGGVQAAGQIVGQVAPQAMASYAAGQVAGKTKEQLAIEIGVKPEEISDERLAEANAVAAGAEPTAGTPTLVYVGAAAAGGLLLALATGII